MYTVNQAIGVRLGINKRWEVIDLSAWTVAQLFTTFRKVQIALMPPNDTVLEYLDLQAIAPTYATFTGHFADILTSIGNASLPTTQTGIALNQRKALFRDAYRAGYGVTPVNALNVVDPSVNQAALPSVRLTRSDTAMDYSYMFNHCLVSVNGLYHRTDTDGVNGLLVVDAMKSLQKSGQNHIGILSFSSMCAIQTVPITNAMIDTSETGKPVVSLPVNMAGKSALLILGGYMVLLDGKAMSQVGDSSYKIDLLALNLVERFYESDLYIDLADLQVDTAAGNTSEVAIADLTSAAVARAWLQLSQSFFVVLDTPEYYTQRQALARTGMPSLYFAYTQPNDPVVLELGRQPSYWSTYEDKQWRISLYNNVIGNELYYTNPLPTWLNTSGADLSGLPNHLSHAYYLEIGRDY